MRYSQPSTNWLALHLQSFAQMRHETFAKLNRVAGGQVRPLRTIESREIWKIRIINSRRVRHLQQRVPGLLARDNFILELFEATAVRKADKDNLAAARSNLF